MVKWRSCSTLHWFVMCVIKKKDFFLWWHAVKLSKETFKYKDCSLVINGLAVCLGGPFVRCEWYFFLCWQHCVKCFHSVRHSAVQLYEQHLLIVLSPLVLNGVCLLSRRRRRLNSQWCWVDGLHSPYFFLYYLKGFLMFFVCLGGLS